MGDNVQAAWERAGAAQAECIQSGADTAPTQPDAPQARRGRIAPGGGIAVSVIKRGSSLVLARCPYCGEEHRHGAGDDGEVGAHVERTSHCLSGGKPYTLAVHTRVAAPHDDARAPR